MMYSKTAVAPAGLPVRPGAQPSVTDGVPHIQLDQTSDADVFRRLVDLAFSDERVTQAPSRASLPGALALTVTPGGTARDEAMIVGREFGHIHRQPGAGSLHLRLPVRDAADVVDRGWGEPHPFALSGSAPGMVLVYAPRSGADLEVVGAIVGSAIDYATSRGTPVK